MDVGAAASSARRSLSKGSDRLPPDELRWAMPELIALWERLSGQPFTHTRNEDGEPTSPAGRFVRSFFDTVDEAVPFTTIVTELERARRSRRKAAAGGAKARQGKSVTP
jgi:hypothetical protein